MSLKSFKDIFATLPGSVNNRRHYGMCLCSCIGAKSATDFPMYHGVAQRSLRSVIIAWNTRDIQKYEQHTSHSSRSSSVASTFSTSRWNISGGKRSRCLTRR